MIVVGSSRRVIEMWSNLMDQIVQQHNEDLQREVQQQRMIQKLRKESHRRPGEVLSNFLGRKGGLLAGR